VKLEGIPETNGNFILNEMKNDKILLAFCFVKQANFRETTFLFRFVSYFTKQKRGDIGWKPYPCSVC
jgi:hypothetical protein